MPRLGTVAARVTAPDVDAWRRVVVFHDGWVEIAGLSRTGADPRRTLRTVGLVVLLVVPLPTLWVVLDNLGAPGLLVLPVAVLASLAFVVGCVIAYREEQSLRRRRWADLEQLAAERGAGIATQRRAGSPVRLGRATSAAELAGWLDPVVLVGADDVRAVTSTDVGVDVDLADGSRRRYRADDPAVARLLGAHAPSA